jgi:hypothetical protein
MVTVRLGVLSGNILNGIIITYVYIYIYIYIGIVILLKLITIIIIQSNKIM